MARQAAINTADDMRWLRDVHLPRLPAKYKSAIIVGNEDYPDRIEVYERKDPLVTDVPVIFEANDEGVFEETRKRHHSTMLQFPRWRVDVTVGGDVVKTIYETATTSKAAIAKAKHKLRGAVSSAGAFKFKATKVETEEAERQHATKTPAQLDREVHRALVLDLKPGAKVIANGYPGSVIRVTPYKMVEVRLPGGPVCVSAEDVTIPGVSQGDA